MLPIWLPGYVELCGELSAKVIQTLLNISPPTIDRILKPIRIHYIKRGRSTTKPGTLLRKQIPIKTNQRDKSRPGFLEADTVAHCGDSTAGMYANTIDFVDIATGWTEQRAVWGTGKTGVLKQINHIEKTLPFPLLNNLYTKEWRLFHNFFCPSVKLIAKERVGAKTIKRHDLPKTP